MLRERCARGACILAVLLVCGLLFGAAPDGLAERYTVTSTNFENYFDVDSNEATLKSSAQGHTLAFEGNFVTTLREGYRINVVYPVTLEGNGASLKDFCFVISADNVSVSGFTFNNTSICAFSLENCSNAILTGNTVNQTAVANKDSYAVHCVGCSTVSMTENKITYTGNTDGSAVNNALLVEDSTGSIVVTNNTFDITLVSAESDWDPDTYEEKPKSEGVVFKGCYQVGFTGNTVGIGYNGVEESYGYDTIYGLSIKNDIEQVDYDESDISIRKNTIRVEGHSYVYAVRILGGNGEIAENTITAKSDAYFAEAINVDRSSDRLVIHGNEIHASAAAESETCAYGIDCFSYMGPINGLTITQNTIGFQADLGFGIKIDIKGNKSKELCIRKNTLTGQGNFLAGISLNMEGKGSVLAAENEIGVPGVNKGTYPKVDAFFSEFGQTYGIAAVYKGDASARIEGNTVVSPSVGIFLRDSKNTTLKENTVNLTATADVDSYAIHCKSCSTVSMIKNQISYTGAKDTDDPYINNALFVKDSTNVSVTDNTFDITLVSAEVEWKEIPEGSLNYVSLPKSEGIVFEGCHETAFTGNTVGVGYEGVMGYYDTIYGLSIKENPEPGDSNQPDISVRKNTIKVKGHSYVYAVNVNGGDCEIVGNTISAESDVDFAVAISMETNSAYAQIKGNAVTSSSVGIISITRSLISGNMVDAGGDYSVDVYKEGKTEDRKAEVTMNILRAKSTRGNESVRATEIDTVYGNSGSIELNLALPDNLSVIREGAFAGIAAMSVWIPASVTTIEGDPFAESAVVVIFGEPDTAAEELAGKPGYMFIPVENGAGE